MTIGMVGRSQLGALVRSPLGVRGIAVFGNAIIMSWIDESSIYQSQPTLIPSDLSYLLSVINKATVKLGNINIPGSNGRQDEEYNVTQGYDVSPVVAINSPNRNPSGEQEIEWFELIRDGFNGFDDIVLIVDSSGSMTVSTIQPGYSSLVSYLSETYPTKNLVEITYSTERWLYEMAQQLLALQ